MGSFDPTAVESFHFVGYAYDEESATASLRYRFDRGPEFVERVHFGGAPRRLSVAQRTALGRCLEQLFLVAGVSYYKAAVPPRIVLEGVSISETTAKFLEALYLHGLGEFAFRNQLDLRGRIRFPASPTLSEAASDLSLPRRSAVPVGGGKDSVVSLERLKAAGEPLLTLSVGLPDPIREVCEIAGTEHVAIERTLSPELFELNEEGAYNGHVPVSAVLSFIFAASAVLHGFDTIVMSNERSANVGNVMRDGIPINHQYSKSLDFERALSEHIGRRVLAKLRYFSLLRPLSELAISREFSTSPQYFSAFCSCNAAFRIRSERVRWCGDCPKCRFVFLALAPFVERSRLVGIFGKNMLADPEQCVGYDELTGTTGHKPFECVGEIEESVAAFLLVSEKPEWQGDLIVQRFAERVRPAVHDPTDVVRRVLTPSDQHLIPAEFETVPHAAS